LSCLVLPFPASSDITAVSPVSSVVVIGLHQTYPVMSVSYCQTLILFPSNNVPTSSCISYRILRTTVCPCPVSFLPSCLVPLVTPLFCLSCLLSHFIRLNLVL
jgi:hypothetical protein